MSDYVDISSHQADAGTIDLSAYWAAGYRDLMLKATEGDGYAWGGMPPLARQWHSFGGRVGYYHWLYGTLSPQAQHDWFWSQASQVWAPGDWMMTDFEDVDPSRWVDDATQLAVLSGFNALCAQHGPIHTYTGNWFIANLPQTRAYLQSVPVVMSDYTNSPPANPYGLTYVAHQYTSSGAIPGMPGRVDVNRWLTDGTLGGGTPIAQEEEDDMFGDPDRALLQRAVDAATAAPKSFVTITVQNAPDDPRNLETWLVRDGYGEKVTSGDLLPYFGGKPNVGQQIVVSSGDELDQWLRRYGAIGTTTQDDLVAALRSEGVSSNSYTAAVGVHQLIDGVGVGGGGGSVDTAAIAAAVVAALPPQISPAELAAAIVAAEPPRAARHAAVTGTFTGTITEES